MHGFEKVLAAAAILALPGVPTLAQVAPPPPPKPAGTPDYTPPPPRPKPRPRVATPNPGAQQRSRSGPSSSIPDVEYESLVKTDDNGKIIPLKEPVEFAALRVNPFVGDKTWKLIKPVLGKRRRRIASAVIDNVDIMMEIENGLIDTLHLDDKNHLSRITEALKPFFNIGTISEDLRSNGALSRVQAELNARIAKEYRGRMMTQVRADAEDANPDDPAASANAMSGYLFNELIWEARDSFRRQLVAAAKHLDKIVPELNLTDAQRQMADAAMAAATAKEPDTEHVRALMLDLMAELDNTARQTLLLRSLEIRGELASEARKKKAPPPDDD